jgi:hypothetical protein
MATGFLGSDQLETSTSNMEIVPNPPSDWTDGYRLLKFSFVNNQDCTVIVNKIETIFIPVGNGFNTDIGDPPITSFVIKESGVTFTWAAVF